MSFMRRTFYAALTVGSLWSATANFDVIPNTLEPFPSNTRGVWYTVLGTGGELVADLCSEFTVLTSSRIHVYVGSCLDSDLSIAEPQLLSPCKNGSGKVQWLSTENEIYYLITMK